MKELSATKRALFEAFLEKAGHKTSRIPPRHEDGDVSLSFAQQRLWLDHQLMPDNAFYNMPGHVCLEGKLDVTALARSINALVSRHEVLRTTFPAKEGRPVQVVAPSLNIELPESDLRHLPDEEREAAAYQLALDEARQPFDLERGPLLRARLVRLGEEEHILLLTIHHIITDGSSTEIFLKEMVTLYEAFATAKVPSLPDLPIQYADFSAWQRQEPQRKIFETQLSYWRRQLRAPLPVFQLPGTRQPEIETFHSKTHELVIPASLTSALRDLAQREGVTLFMLLLAGFKTLLYRYSGQNDILVGTGSANRTRPEIEGLIGFFANTLVLRTEIKATDRFRDLLDQVRQNCLAAYAHQDLPFELLVDELRPTRNLRRNPLFQVAMAVQDAPLRTPDFAGIKLRPYEVAADYTIFDLYLLITDRGSDLKAQLSYNTSLFEESVTRLMLHHFKNVLEAVAADPEKKLLDIALLDEEEKPLSRAQSVNLDIYASEQFA